MKLTINTDTKTVELRGDHKFDELVTFLQAHLPDWKEYKVIPQAPVVHWYPTYQPYTYPITWVSGTANSSTSLGHFTTNTTLS